MSKRAQRLQIRWCREGVVYTIVLSFILAGAVFREFNLLIILAGMMMGPLLISLLLVSMGLRRLSIQRKLPDGVGAGELFDVQVSLRNERYRLAAWGITVRDIGMEQAQRISAAGSDTESEVDACPVLFFPHVPAGCAATSTYTARLARRGRYPLEQITLSTRMPFGLWRALAGLTCTDEVLVYPRLGTLTRDWRRRLSRREMEGQQSVSRQGTVDGDYYGLRDWRVGDSRRWIHWRTSARRNQLTVRQFERHTNRDISILLDLQCAQQNVQGQEWLEHAISFAATACLDLCRTGSSHLTLGTTGRTNCWLSGMASPGLQREIYHCLALAEFHTTDHLVALLQQASRELRSAELVILISLNPIDPVALLKTSAAAAPEFQRLMSMLRILHPGQAPFVDMFQPTSNLAGEAVAAEELKSARDGEFSSTSASSPSAEPGVALPAVTQPGVAQPGATQPGVAGVSP